MMMSSPLLATPHSRSISHTPSPTSSPKLVPIAGTMAPVSLSLSSSASALPSTTTSQATISQSAPTRSFARGPQARPYGPPMLRKKELDGDTKRFAELVVETVDERRLSLASSSPVSRGRKLEGEKGLIEMVENVSLQEAHHGARNIERRGTQGRMMSGSWEAERADLIVDYPVWSPGCFQDLSTLQSLREKTLSHIHLLLSHLQNAHHIHATYRLLARSAVSCPVSNPSPFYHGWGCIRLAPCASQEYGRAGAKVRRASLVHSGRPSSFSPERKMSDSAVVDSDDEDVSPQMSPRAAAAEIKLREGFWSGSASGSEDEDEEEVADVIVAREIEKRGGKEGMAFLMTLFGQPAIILT
ncbi:hypothetical protein C343_03884 [Cryptococcus neoformans C23]|uniref:Uncharacterized protein n=2 Tax=Cryptococcus neoformans TaxID=5207 RepID=A0A854QCC2_CRYNE|nr:hypothetical protein CNAG_02041 [Cryptococcus neoformans var. grubii H99]AUB25622.1 hypothetical protein CKF44_02041 [Cryptococcus neoformans var. grubii]OWZ31186.1 hypothetical protein C347_03946 [Cryptococcus neoformans var. grubii AD2-60a]OWZ40606.1 hypothetical protein C353_03794 [Cryptococcus neoformans var. grubii AD1-83a]OWZ43287.1 hypothetical protein C343_03884 [Cryptococcus neoformans var. grubii C23]OWZ54130.1 hypothetical protein C368_03886 [Cryptococcus neoformans var. grubii 1|eukprot:XP_012049894.1 hypothetical protein CNAG_02041 [Cryptococcus neoformans var. grubii H99]